MMLQVRWDMFVVRICRRELGNVRMGPRVVPVPLLFFLVDFVAVTLNEPLAKSNVCRTRNTTSHAKNSSARTVAVRGPRRMKLRTAC